MTTEITTLFTFQQRQVRVAGTPDKPLFCAADVCAVLGFSSPNQTIANLPDDEKGVETFDTLGGRQKFTVLSESGLYRLIFRSTKPVAEEFRRWVLHEVLPAIRRTGGYQIPPPASGGSALDYAEALIKVMREQENRLARVESLAIQANSYNSSNTGFFTLRGYANILGIRLSLSDAKSIGKRASEFCRSHGIQPGRARDELFGEVNSYPVEVLEEMFEAATLHHLNG